MSATSWVLFGFGLLCVSSCTVGEKKFSCPGRPAGVHCMSTSEVYQATETTDVVAPTAPKALGDDPNAISPAGSQRTSNSSPSGGHASSAKQSVRNAAAPGDANTVGLQKVPYPAVDAPIPIRVPPQVMRAWIAPWRDSHDRLHGGEKAFLDIASGHWAFGESAPVEPVRFFSIQPVSVDTKGSVGKDQSAQAERVGPSERSKTTSTQPKKETSNASTSLSQSQ